MYPPQYSVTHQNGFDHIHIKDNPIFITVYPLEGNFYQTLGEQRYYGDDHGDLLVFETSGYYPLANPFHLQCLSGAIRWYASNRLDYPEMEISFIDPRPGLNLKPVC